jgi:TonB family protein
MNPVVHTAEILPPRALLFLGIVALHAVFAWFLAKGLMVGITNYLAPVPIDASFVPERTPPPTQIPVEAPVLRAPSIEAPTPEEPWEIDVPTEPDTTLIATPELIPSSAGSGTIAPPAEPIRLIGRNSLPNSADYYPPHLRRSLVEGSTQVRACVNEEGRLQGLPSVEQSSGTAALDNAAVRVARDGRYARSMQGEKAVPNCFRFRIVFTLE